MENADTWVQILSSQKDWLYEKLANPLEGWNIVEDGSNFDVPLNELDASAYNILQKTILQKKRIALALPRVKNGVSLSIIAYLVVNRFLKQQNRPLPNFTALHLNNGQSVVIATRNRKLRDFFLESSLTFSHTNFPFTHFPISRINRAGEMVPLVTRNESAGLVTSDPIIFYHFDSLESYPEKLKHGCFIGELVETDSPNVVRRLCEFVNAVQAESALVLVNEFSTNSLSLLKDNGYQVIAFTTEDITRTLLPTEHINMPSLSSSLALCPSNISLNVDLIDDETISLKLSKILQTLMSLNKKLDSNKPNILFKAWSLFYALKDLAVPLERLEQSRKIDPWLKTIKHNIEQTFNFPISKLDENYSLVLGPIWGTLGSEFSELYEYLKSNSPKYNRLMDFIKKQSGKSDKWSIVFYSQTQAEVFKEELLINTEWVEEESNISVGYINDFINESKTCDKVVLIGVWKKSDQAKLLSLLPHKINLICYNSELPSLPIMLNNLNKNELQELKRITKDSLQEVGLNQASINLSAIGDDWMIPDEESRLLITHYKELMPVEVDTLSQFGESIWGLTDTDQNIDEDISLEDTESTEETDETIPTYKLLLENNRTIFVPLEQEIFAYSDNEGTVESKLPDALEVGDIILLYSEDQNREMFENVLRRTQELSGTDPRILSLWKTALKSLRETYDIKNPNSLRAYLHDLQDQGCKKIEQTTKLWLKGTALAPRDREDIESLLNLIEFKNASVLSKIIHREIESVRVFHRKLGRRLRGRLGALLSENKLEGKDDPVDREIDEILEMADPVAIKEISKDIKYVPKSDVRINVFG